MTRERGGCASGGAEATCRQVLSGSPAGSGQGLGACRASAECLSGDFQTSIRRAPGACQASLCAFYCCAQEGDSALAGPALHHGARDLR